MIKNPSLYEINTRVWIRQFDTEEKKAVLDDVPDSYWIELKRKGMDYIWLMGIWRTNPSTIKKYCYEENLTRSYRAALKDWKDEDVIGSPYSIDKYELNPELGDEQTLQKLRGRLHVLGLKLILDFIPNHFSAESSLIQSNPEVFLQTDKELFERDRHTYFLQDGNERKYFAHGRDPFFPAWQDTVQVNYFSDVARDFMIRSLINISNVSDGVRADMAMLALNNVFKNTWAGVLDKLGYSKPGTEFWSLAISIVKDINPEFIFLAEAYWDLEWDLQQLGFDFTYDKKLTDRIETGYVPDIKDHLFAEQSYQEKSIRFLENHDEKRSAAVLGNGKTIAAATLISTIQGMRFYYDGQFEGKKIKLPVQLGREPAEHKNYFIEDYYKILLPAVNTEIFKYGDWRMMEVLPAWDGDTTFYNILAWQWQYKDEIRLVVINFSDSHARARIKLDTRGYFEVFSLTDLLTDQKYVRSSGEVFNAGLYVELKNYQSHIFAF